MRLVPASASRPARVAASVSRSQAGTWGATAAMGLPPGAGSASDSGLLATPLAPSLPDFPGVAGAEQLAEVSLALLGHHLTELVVHPRLVTRRVDRVQDAER